MRRTSSRSETWWRKNSAPAFLLSPTDFLGMTSIRTRFAVHPYKRPTIGSIKDLDAATLADVQKFHTTYYRPDNATLVVVGDFDAKQLDGWVDQYFNAVGKPDIAIPRVTIKEPLRDAPKKITENGPNVPLPAVAL